MPFVPKELLQHQDYRFTDDEIETIKALIEDRGFEYSLKSDTDKVRALAKKLKMDRIIY